jgi:hypothetical protein
VTAAGTFDYPGNFRLAQTTSVTSNWGQPVSFTSNANCQVVADSDGSTYARSTSGGQCKVTLSVPKRFGLKALTRTWTLNYKG